MTEPKIRFKRDDGRTFPDWEQAPFGDVIEQYSERTKTENEDTLLSCAIEGVYLNSELFGHQRGSSTIGYKKIDKGTLILSAQNLHLGNANVNLRFEHGMISPAYNTYHIKGCDVNFMAQWIKREATKKFFFDATTTGASECRRNVMWDELYKQKMGVPSLPEQQKIADFLSNVDEVIAASEEEVANLEQQKKAVMQKIFSQEVRFKKEDGSDFPDWEEITFDSLYEPLNNNTYSRDCLNYESGEAKNIHYGDILVKFGEICDVQKEELPFVNDGNSVQKYASLQDGDIILADTAEDETVGKAIELYNVNGDKVISGLHTMVCRPRLTFAPKYLGYYMNSSSYHSQLKPYMQGIKVTSIGRKNIAETMISYPADAREQQFIADFLTSYDEAITAAKQELVKWKELKKGLLQQMFV